MIIIRNWISMFCMTFTLFACTNDKSTKSDEFYTEKGEWDSARIPLLKPYEAVLVNKELGWSMNLDALDGDTGFSNIKKATVVNDVILVYSVNSILHSAYVNESWHVVIPAKRIEKGFDNHMDYMNYLRKLGFTAEPRLFNIDSISHYYANHDLIDWKLLDR